MIQPLVEGYGEVDAVPVLLRRLMHEALGVFGIEVARPIRQKRSHLLSQNGLRKALGAARSHAGVTAILVIFDLDDDCARDLVPDLLDWGRAETERVPFAVALARREYEAWFLAGLTSLAGKRRIDAGAVALDRAETIRDAKGRLSRLMPRNKPYVERADQASFSAMLDLEQAYRGASSFRKLVKELCRLLTELGHAPVIPPEWTAGSGSTAGP
jgi:hypothetical protein